MRGIDIGECEWDGENEAEGEAKEEGKAEAKAMLDTFAGGEDRYVVVTVAGPQSGSCNSAFGDAAAAPILHEFTNSVPNGVMGDICLGDLSQPLEAALSVIQTSCDTFPPVD